MTAGHWRLAPTPYVLPTHAFRFRALAAFAGRAPLGGARELALGCYLAARLVHELLQPHPLPETVRRLRASGARSWLLTLALPAGGRAPLLRLMDASAETCAACAAPLRQLIELVDLQLDSASIAELERLANALAAASCAEPRPPASAIAE